MIRSGVLFGGNPARRRVGEPIGLPEFIKCASPRDRNDSILVAMKGKAMPSRSLQKQISIFLPLEDWKRVRREAARRDIPITELCRRWMGPDLSDLRRTMPDPAGYPDRAAG